MTNTPAEHVTLARLDRLREYRVLETPFERPFDRVARLAAMALDMPMAAMTLVDDSRAWFTGRHGFELDSLPCSATLTTTVLASEAPVIITDTRADPRSRDLPLVVGPPHVRSYVSLAMTTPDGLRIGTICVFDTRLREAPAAASMVLLRELAALAVDELELRRTGGGAERLRVEAAAGRPTAAQRGLYAAYVAKSEFLSSLSHELRAPLNAITGYAGLIAAADDTPAVAAEQAGEIMASARHMLSLVNDILEYSRLEAGQLPIAWQRVRLGVVAEEAMRMVAVFAASRGVALERVGGWDRPADVGALGFEMRGDPIRMKQVMVNLLTNAVKFTSRGGHVRVAMAHDAADMIRIEVADDGMGIAPEDVAKALTPFGQIVGGENGIAEGTGLGLPIAKALVERQGGSLRLHSARGQGTTVTVCVPRMAAGRSRDLGAGDAAAGLVSEISGRQ